MPIQNRFSSASTAFVLVLVTLSALFQTRLAFCQDSPDKSLATLTFGSKQWESELEVTTWASEPMLNNPTAIEVDSRGRVWISEGLNYRMSVKDQAPLARVAGADAIKVLSDTDGDGQADRMTVFADNIFPVPLGLAIEELWTNGKFQGTRVYVGNTPNLLVLEDTDGDDRADRRYSLLTGFKGIDSDHGLHGMTFGPDGKLYFTVGDARYGADKLNGGDVTLDVIDKSNRHIRSARLGTTLRVNRDGSNLQVLAYGQRNNYEAAVDSFGNVFCSDNDDDGNRGCRMIWVMDGGHYGYQDPRSTRHWGEELPGNIPKLVGTGNGAPCGIAVYESELISGLASSVLQIDAVTRQINLMPLVRHGTAFRSDYKVFLRGTDAWFRPVDVAIAPDGSLFLADWYDSGVGGNRFADQNTGRVYWIRPKGHVAKPSVPDLRSSNGRISALNSCNPPTRHAALLSLIASADDSKNALLDAFRVGTTSARARALYALAALPDGSTANVVEALQDRDPRIREVALQILARDAVRESLVETDQASLPTAPAIAHIKPILRLASDPDAGVRRALLMSIRNVPLELTEHPLRELAKQWDGRDRYYLEALRAALVNRPKPFLRQLLLEMAESAVKEGWSDALVAQPPYYPNTSNDAFLRPADELPLGNTASRVTGLAWVLEDAETLPALKLVLERNRSLSVELSAYAAIGRIADIKAGELLVERLRDSHAGPEFDSARREAIRLIAMGVIGPWSSLRNCDELARVLEEASNSPNLQLDAIQAIGIGRIQSFGPTLLDRMGQDGNSPEVRALLVKSIGQIGYRAALPRLKEWIDEARGSSNAGAVEIAALGAIQDIAGPEQDHYVLELALDSKLPLDLRRRALQLQTVRFDAAEKLLRLHVDQKVPAELSTELSFLLHNHPDRRVRELAAKQMPIAVSAEKKVHNVATILAMQGDVAQGRKLFHEDQRTICFKCHQAEGKGGKVGPDLSSIGVKYGRKELLYHVLNPSGAINYSYVTQSLSLNDGRVLNGLIAERGGGNVTLRTATADSIVVREADIESQRPLPISLMPDDLVARLSEQELANLIEYLSVLIDTTAK